MSFCWRHLLIPAILLLLLVGAFHFHTFSSTSESMAPKLQFPDNVFPAHQRIVEWFKLRERKERPRTTEISRNPSRDTSGSTSSFGSSSSTTYNSSTPTEAFTSTATSTSSESSTCVLLHICSGRIGMR